MLLLPLLMGVEVQNSLGQLITSQIGMVYGESVFVHEVTDNSKRNGEVVVYFSDYEVISRKTITPAGLGMVDYFYLLPNNSAEKLENLRKFVDSNLKMLGIGTHDVDCDAIGIVDETQHEKNAIFSEIQPAIVSMKFKIKQTNS